MEDLPEEPSPYQVENLPESSPHQEETKPTSGLNPFLLGLTLAVAFVLGLIFGFFGRPAIIQDLPIEVVVTVVPNPDSAAVAQATVESEALSTSADAQAANAQAKDETVNDQPTPTIMDFVLSDARHFQGDGEALVTLVEFSDFN